MCKLQTVDTVWVIALKKYNLTRRIKTVPKLLSSEMQSYLLETYELVMKWPHGTVPVSIKTFNFHTLVYFGLVCYITYEKQIYFAPIVDEFVKNQ